MYTLFLLFYNKFLFAGQIIYFQNAKSVYNCVVVHTLYILNSALVLYFQQ